MKVEEDDTFIIVIIIIIITIIAEETDTRGNVPDKDIHALTIV